jgi:hypothetical protein
VFQHLSRVFYHRIIVLQAQPGMQKLFYPKDIFNKIERNKKLKQLAKEKDNSLLKVTAPDKRNFSTYIPYKRYAKTFELGLLG